MSVDVAQDGVARELAPPPAAVNDLARWQMGNDEFLTVALHWLRLRLRSVIEQSATEAFMPASSSALKDEVSSLRMPPVAEDEMSQAAQAMQAAARLDPPPALYMLSQQLGLSRFERETLLLCAAMELDTRIAPLCAQAQNEANRPYPTFALAMRLFDEPAWDILSPERPLRFWRLLEINQPGAQPLTTSALRADERIVNFIKGLNYLDDRLRPLLLSFGAPALRGELPPSQQESVDRMIDTFVGAQSADNLPVVQVVGVDPISKQLVAQQAATQLGLHLERLPVELLPTDATELETFARLWHRESVLMPIALYIDVHEADVGGRTEGESRTALPPLQRFLARSHGVFFVSMREVATDLGASTVTVHVEKPTPREQHNAWHQALGDVGGDSPALLSGQFNLNTLTIQQVVQRVTQTAGSNGHIAHARLWDACLVNTGPRLDVLAQRLTPKAAWDDIVLPVETEATLRQIADQVRQRSTVYDAWGFRDKLSRGLGINALFAGDSGTGKTMAAEVLASDLRLNLYRIDLSGVVSKYIGETEKNLRRLFDAAEDGGAILFFDEADALFGKRSEVKDSHDRYANIEINYLLQRMESYGGLAILATNMKSALDEAFMRRLRFIVNFAFPSQRERRVIWQRVFPAQTPLAHLDYNWLARFNLSGGAINNIALNAAFLSAQRNEAVSMPILLEAVRAEYRKLERPIKEADFQWT